MKTKIVKILPCVLLGVIFLLLVFLNVFYQDHWLDSDMAAEMLFSKVLNEGNHVFATPDWYYSTEFRFLYTHLLMAPLLRLGNDWHMIRLITNVVFYLLLLISYFYLMRPLKVKHCQAVLTGCILLLPFSETMMTHMQMGNTYMAHVIIVFLFFGMFLRLCLGGMSRLYGRVTLIFYLLLAVICGVSGVRYLLALQCPLVLAAAVFLLKTEEFQSFRRCMTKEGFKWIWHNFSAVCLKYAVLGAAASVAGYGINVLYVSRHYVFQTYESTNFIAVYQGVLNERFQNALGSLLMLFGYIPDKSVLSLRGIITIISFILPVVLIYCTVNRLKESSGARYFVALFLTVSFFLNVFVFVFTTSTMVPRYYITIFVFALPVLACFMEEAELPFDRLAIGVLLTVCLLLSTGKTVLSFISTDKNADKRQVAEFLVQNDYTFGFATYTNGNIITELTDGSVELANIGDPEHLEYFKWSSPMCYYEEGYHEGETFLLLSKDEAAAYAAAEAVKNGMTVYEDDSYVVLTYDSVSELMSYAESVY